MRNFLLCAGLLCALSAPLPSLCEDGFTDVSVKPLGVVTNDLWAENGVFEFPVNTALLRRIVLSPDDIGGAVMQAELLRPGKHVEILLSGIAADADTVQIGGSGFSGLQGNGDSLGFFAWKSGWHYNGGMSAEDFGVEAMFGDGRRAFVPLPPAEKWEGCYAVTELGVFRAAGISRRDAFASGFGSGRAEYASVTNAVCAGSAGTYKTGSGAFVSAVREGVVKIHTNGRSSFSKEFDFAPGIVFVPSEPGAYRFCGKAAFRCEGDTGGVAYMSGALRSPGGSLKGLKAELSVCARDGREFAADAAEIPAASGGRVRFSGKLAEELRRLLSDGVGDAFFRIRINGENKSAVLRSESAAGRISVREYPKHIVFPLDIKPVPGVYVKTENGHLTYGGKRLRLWGQVMNGTGERIRALGFNCVRTWFQSSFYDKESAKRGAAMNYTPGDGSSLDKFDASVADWKKHGMFIMFATTVGFGMPLEPVLEDGSWLADEVRRERGEEAWKEWRDAVKEAGLSAAYRLSYADDLLWRIRMRHAYNVFSHTNPYTGRKYSEEEMIAIVEIANEAGIVKNWLEGGIEKWPEYFKSNLRKKWNDWLSARYGGEEGLVRAWGSLLPGESLSGGTVELKPVVSERNQFPAARQSDFVRFAVETVNARNREYRDFCRTLAPEGVGVNVVPFSYDSQYRPNIPWLYTNSLGGMSTVSMYFWDDASMLTKPPALYVLDSSRIKGMPAVIYETQRARPSPYRAEYPYMLAALASWQDFDVVIWHGNWFGGKSPEQLLAERITPGNANHYWDAVHLETDPVMSSAIAAAGRIFISGAIAPASDPVCVRMYEDDIFSYRKWNGADISGLTFTRGTEIEFSSGSDPAAGENPLPPAPRSADGSVKSGDSIIWDWEHGRLIIDTPSAKVYAGKVLREPYVFKDGIALGGITAPFAAISLVSLDGRPLTGSNSCCRAVSSAVFDARNTGFEYEYGVLGGPVAQARAVKNRGWAPAVVDPVEYTLSFPEKFDAGIVSLDFAHRAEGRITLGNTGVIKRAHPCSWIDEITFTGRRGAASAAAEENPGAAGDAADARTSVAAGEFSNAVFSGWDAPFPGVTWGDSLEFAHRRIREGAAVFSRISIPSGKDDGSGDSIAVHDTDAIAGVPADVTLQFGRGGTLSRVSVVFTGAASFAEISACVSKTMGTPKTVKSSDEAFDEQRAEWVKTYPNGSVRTVVTEAQATVRMEMIKTAAEK